MVIAPGLSRLFQNILPQCLRVFRRLLVGRVVGQLMFRCLRNSKSMSFRMKSMIFHSMGMIFHENSMKQCMLNRVFCRMLVGTCWESLW